MSEIPRYVLLGVWMALGGKPIDFETWMHDRGTADAWAQLMAAVRDDIAALAEDSNPTAGLIVDLCIRSSTSQKDTADE